MDVNDPRRKQARQNYERYEKMDIPPVNLIPVTLDKKECLAFEYPRGGIMSKEKALELIEQLNRFYNAVESKDIYEFNTADRSGSDE